MIGIRDFTFHSEMLPVHSRKSAQQRIRALWVVLHEVVRSLISEGIHVQQGLTSGEHKTKEMILSDSESRKNCACEAGMATRPIQSQPQTCRLL
jgi:hypothetical protein